MLYSEEFLIGKYDCITWDLDVKKLFEENILCTMKKYMDLAWRNVVDHNHTAIVESIEYFIGWLWLLNNTKLIKFALDENNYPKYGAPVLAEICKVYKFLIPDGVLIQRMLKNEPCQPTCAQGCLE